MSSAAARSFGESASVMRPTSPYSKAPPLAHSTTSPMACFLVVATRRATVRNSLPSWLNLEAAADPLPLLCGASVARTRLVGPRSFALASACGSDHYCLGTAWREMDRMSRLRRPFL